jgi:hypothetical protein
MKRRSSQSYAEREIIQLLKTHPTGQLSYDTMAAILDYDRRTLISTVARLRYTGSLVVEPGAGRVPNKYILLL